MASLSQGRTAAALCGLFTHKSVPVIFEPPCSIGILCGSAHLWDTKSVTSLTIVGINVLASEARTINLYKNMRTEVMKCHANIYFNRQRINTTVTFIPTM